MKKIIPHLWYNKEAKEATAFYTTLFPNSSINNVTTVHDTPSGDCDIVSYTLAGQDFMAISGGPYFSLNPSFSLFVTFDNEAEIDEVWNKLSDGAKIMMEYQKYPWATKYGWLTDKFGLSWQLSMNENQQATQKITPFLMFTQGNAGKVQEALSYYTNIFPSSHIDMTVPYTEGDGDTPGLIKHSRFTLNGLEFMAMESTGPHQFIFNEAASFIVKCDTQDEIDMYWEKLSAVPESEQCGWCKDKFGVSWQINPTFMDEVMASNDQEKIARVTQAFLKMKKFNIAELEQAANKVEK
jgi:predicted 3-demethylubiquinone-9 3-methyltransferase (glyoxalase superfamily)